MALRVTTEAEPMCGSSTTFCMARNSSGTAGSLANTSSPAARIVPDFSAAIKVPEVKTKLAAQGLFPKVICGEEFRTFIGAQVDLYKTLTKEFDIKMQ